MKRYRQNLVSFFLDIIVVVVGVLIAVSINNWKENRDNRKYIQKTLAVIKTEIAQSKHDIERVVDKHLLVADSIKHSLQRDSEAVEEMLGRLGGIQSADAENIGLRFFISHKADLLDYELISELSKIESTTEVLEKKMDKLLDYTYHSIGKKDKNSKLKFLIHLQNVIDSEQHLLYLYSSFLKKNKDFLKETE